MFSFYQGNSCLDCCNIWFYLEQLVRALACATTFTSCLETPVMRSCWSSLVFYRIKLLLRTTTTTTFCILKCFIMKKRMQDITSSIESDFYNSEPFTIDTRSLTIHIFLSVIDNSFAFLCYISCLKL